MVTSSASLIVVSHAASQMSLVTSSSGSPIWMAFAGDVAMATVAAMAREAPAMRSKTVFTMDARSAGCDGERDACVEGYRYDAGSAAGSAWTDVVDTAVHRCAASRLHVTGGIRWERCVHLP